MTNEKKLLYKKAYCEIYELIKRLPKNQQDMIPQNFIKYITNEMDKEYFFEFDESKSLLEQNYMVETQALIIKLYEKYLADENEKKFWDGYDKICFAIIEKDKKEKYSIDNLF